MRAMILSAGYGTRLWPLTEDRTKPAIPILGKPLVGYVAEYLAQFGCDEIIVNLHHRPESVRRALGDGSKFGVKLHYVEEPEILGTSGALYNARSLLDETFLVVNGKIITDIDLATALETHRREKAIATLVLMPNPACEKFSTVQTLEGCVKGFGGMPVPEQFSEQEPPLMFTGIQILEPRILDYVPPGIFSHSTTDVYPQAIAKGERIAAHVANGRWFELSTIQRYLEISLRLLAETKASYSKESAAKSLPMRPSSNQYLGHVEVEVAPCRRAILADNVKIRRGESIENSAVVWLLH